MNKFWMIRESADLLSQVKNPKYKQALSNLHQAINDFESIVQDYILKEESKDWKKTLSTVEAIRTSLIQSNKEYLANKDDQSAKLYLIKDLSFLIQLLYRSINDGILVDNPKISPLFIEIFDQFKLMKKELPSNELKRLISDSMVKDLSVWIDALRIS